MRNQNNLKEKLNLQLAWQRHRKDLNDQSFSDHPFEPILIEENLDKWANDLLARIDNFTPARSEVINVDKPRHHLRPGSRLRTEDAVLYQALLLVCVQEIRNNLLWSASKQRFAYILSEDQSKTNWCINEFRRWNDFRITSLKYISWSWTAVIP